jgi:NAD(P)-dependent dehydrogenase (short-subunit alcohol dehydrogenase family)
VAPGPIWTPFIPSTLCEDSVANFGKQVPMKRPGQPAELATAYVMLADPLLFVQRKFWNFSGLRAFNPVRSIE